MDRTKNIISPPYHADPALVACSRAPRGTLHRFTMPSQGSAYYSGVMQDTKLLECMIDLGTVQLTEEEYQGHSIQVPIFNAEEKTPNLSIPCKYTRNCAVYIPANYRTGTPIPFLVCLDGAAIADVLCIALDNLIHEGRIPSIVAILVDSPGGDGQGSQRGLEYDTVSTRYAQFVEHEVLPKVTQDYSVTLTSDPAGRAVMGGSSAGSAAFTMAWLSPHLYSRVACFSGAFVNQQYPYSPETPRGCWEYPTQISLSERRRLRIYLTVGEHDFAHTLGEESCHNWRMASERMAAALHAKAYDYQFVFAEDSGHYDPLVVGAVLPSALEWLWEDFQGCTEVNCIASVYNNGVRT